ncbi:MAG: (2Fe-2S)-binding protein [Anaerolineae bacterium]|jgi:ferredoxin|nr:(2Fe-2S)-binding protein [Anaerolineae bacterium]
MPTIHLKDGTSFEAEHGQRLILALVDHEVDILHRCGGNAKCTTCRVVIHQGEPDRMTVAEYNKLAEKENLLGVVRLSCQIPCNSHMLVEPLMTLANSGLDDPGGRPADQITPEAEWRDAPLKS